MLIALAKILDLVPSWLWAALTAALLATGLGLNVKLASARHSVEALTTQRQTLELSIAQANSRAAAQTAALATQALKAKNEASIRESTLRRLAVAARAESTGLHDDLNTLRDTLANATREAAVERASSLSVVLDQCSARYTELAGKADRHASDVKTLIDSCPAAP